MRLSTIVNSGIVVALLLTATMLSVLGSSLAFNEIEKAEAESTPIPETNSQSLTETPEIEPETRTEPEPELTEEECPVCGDNIQPTETNDNSNEESEEVLEENTVTTQPPIEDPCYPCFLAIPYGLNDAKEELKDIFPKLSDYDKTELGWGLIYINDVISWFTSVGPTINAKISNYGYILGQNFALALGNATAVIIDILESAWQFYKDERITFFVLTMIFSPLYILPVFFATLLSDYLDLCFGNSGSNNTETTINEQANLEILETTISEQQQSQNI